MSGWIARFQEYRPYVDMLNATASLLAIITWVVAVPLLIVAWRRSRQVSIRVFGIEATFEQGLEAAAAIGAAAGQRAATGRTMPEIRPALLARSLERVIARLKGRGLRGRSVLWVDDAPSHSAFEIRALKAFGIDVTTAGDTTQALDALSSRRFDLIVSDMARPSGEHAGYELLDGVRGRGDTTPFLIYSTSYPPERRQEAVSRGAQGLTNNPQELVELTIEMLARDGP